MVSQKRDIEAFIAGSDHREGLGQPSIGIQPPGNVIVPQKNEEQLPVSEVNQGFNVNLENEEVWVETKSDNDGKFYYYNAKTRETTWDKPQEKEGVRVLTLEQVEELAKKLKIREATDINMECGQQLGGPPIATKDGPPPASPNSNQFVMQRHNGPPQFRMFPPFGMTPDHHGPRPFIPVFRPPWGLPPGCMPRQGAPHPAFRPPWMGRVPGFLARCPLVNHPIETCNWSEHTSPDNKKYYYNAQTQESVWEKPKELTDFEKRRNNPNCRSPATITDPSVTQAIAAAQVAAAAAKAESEASAPAEKQEVKANSISSKEIKPIDKSKPISSTPVTGTPWCVVWTGDNRSFFYNPSTKKSVWERPLELIGRADVKEMLKSQISAEKMKNISQLVTSHDILANSSSQNDEDLKNKKNGPQLVFEDDIKKNVKHEASLTKGAPNNMGKEAAMEAEIKAARERQIVPLDQRMKQFHELLTEKQISAFSTWEKELHKIVFDPRYLLLASKDRKQAFDQYIRDRADLERQEKRNRIKEKKVAFKTLLEEAELSSKSLFFKDFAVKYANDERFTAVEKIREKESMFNEHMVALKKKENEDRIAKEKEKEKRKRERSRSPKTESKEDRKRNKKRSKSGHHEAVSHFEALLVDLIRQPDYTWKEAKKILKKDTRYDSISSNLEKSEREMRFDEHIDRLVAKKKENYRKMLEECKSIELDSSWKEIKKVIKDDPRYMKYSSSDRKCEKAFNEYLKDRMSKAKGAFKELLQETKKITDKSLSMVKEKDAGHMSEIIELLSKDKRYLDLESVQDERSNILTSYLEDLERRGPPPPPTASEPQRRSAKI